MVKRKFSVILCRLFHTTVQTCIIAYNERPLRMATGEQPATETQTARLVVIQFRHSLTTFLWTVVPQHTV